MVLARLVQYRNLGWRNGHGELAFFSTSSLAADGKDSITTAQALRALRALESEGAVECGGSRAERSPNPRGRDAASDKELQWRAR